MNCVLTTTSLPFRYGASVIADRVDLAGVGRPERLAARRVDRARRHELAVFLRDERVRRLRHVLDHDLRTGGRGDHRPRERVADQVPGHLRRRRRLLVALEHHDDLPRHVERLHRRERVLGAFEEPLARRRSLRRSAAARACQPACRRSQRTGSYDEGTMQARSMPSSIVGATRAASQAMRPESLMESGRNRDGATEARSCR